MEASLDEWVNRIGHAPVPVLGRTIKELNQHCILENAPIAKLADVVERDPGLVVHLLRMMNQKTSSSLRTDVTSVQQALMMMGTTQLSELPKHLPSLEKNLQEPATTRLLKTFCRAYHAARQATAWAGLRQDMTPDEVFAATQLHFLGEMHIAIHAPQQLDRVDHMRNEKNIASEEAQYIVLGFTLDQLTAKLARLWNLPELVLEALHPENARYPRAYGIMLAVQLARGAATNWYSEKTRHIQEQVAEWLKRDLDFIIAGSHRLAAEVARDSALYKVRPAAAGLPLIYTIPQTPDATEEAEQTQKVADICLMPQVNVLKELMGKLHSKKIPMQNCYELISAVLKGMHDGIGLNRVLFASVDAENGNLQPEKIIGADNDPVFSRFQITLKEPQLFTHLLEKTQAVLINDQSRPKFWSLVPVEFQKLIGTNSFMAMSVVIDNKPLGLFYADRHNSACQLDERSYKYFKLVCSQTIQLLQQLPHLDFSHA